MLLWAQDRCRWVPWGCTGVPSAASRIRLMARDRLLGCTHTGLLARLVPVTSIAARLPSAWHNHNAGLHAIPHVASSLHADDMSTIKSSQLLRWGHIAGLHPHSIASNTGATLLTAGMAIIALTDQLHANLNHASKCCQLIWPVSWQLVSNLCPEWVPSKAVSESVTVTNTFR